MPSYKNPIAKDVRLFLDPNEVAFRKIYKTLLENEEIFVIFRPGQRLCGDWRGYCLEQEVSIKIIDQTGADWAMLPPKFIEGFNKKVIIKKVETKTLGELVKYDFFGASPDTHDKESLRYHLGILYNLSGEELTDDYIVTKTTFEYR